MTEEELQAIADRLAKVEGQPWPVRERDGPYTQYDVVTTVLAGGEHVAALIEAAPRDMAALLAEVRFLRGQLSDLCEDSRAAAKVIQLREALANVICELGKVVDAIEKHHPGWWSVRYAYALEHVQAIAQRGLKVGG